MTEAGISHHLRAKSGACHRYSLKKKSEFLDLLILEIFLYLE